MQLLKVSSMPNRKSIAGCIFFLAQWSSQTRDDLLRYKILEKQGELVYFNFGKAHNDYDQARKVAKKKILKRSSKVYYSEIQNFPNGKLETLDRAAMNKMVRSMSFGEFPDPQ